MVLLKSRQEALKIQKKLSPQLLALPGVIMVRVGKAAKSKKAPWKISKGDYYTLVVTIDKNRDSQILRDNIRKITGMYPARIETSGPIVAYKKKKK
jgi:hypothetical protein